MLEILKTVTASPEQFEIVIEGMRNPLNSWDSMDSAIEYIVDEETMNEAPFQFHMGEKDFGLMKSLAKGGPVNAKYRRMLPVWVTINAPLYWWKEFDTYKVGTTSNSCSTMHKIHAKEFTMDDFSHEHLLDRHVDPDDLMKFVESDGNEIKLSPMDHLEDTISMLNFYREKFLETMKDTSKDITTDDTVKRHEKAKLYWWQMIQGLGTSYNQIRTIFTNYEVLHGIRHWRPNHKLDEWHIFCDWIDTLPYSEIISMEE